MALNSEGDNDGDVTVVISNTATTSMIPNIEIIFNTKYVTREVKHAVSDSGATGHFLIEGAPIKIRKFQTTPSASRYPMEGASNNPTREILTYHGSLTELQGHT